MGSKSEHLHECKVALYVDLSGVLNLNFELHILLLSISIFTTLN